MIYRVIMDGNDILNYQEREYALISPSLNMELNTAGSFEFTMPPSHAFYDDIHPITSTIEVYEDENLLWFGRPMEIKRNYLNNRQVYCEGALAFFNDSVQRLHEYDSISLHSFFRTVISNHNGQVAPDRQFTVGTITVQDKTVYRKLNYESTFDCLKRQCLDAEGGYFFVRREQGVSYIDWFESMPYECNQPVEFGLNLLDLTSDFDGSSIATCVLPLGDTVEGTEAPLTVASVNSGSDVIDSAAAETYGRITRAVQFPGVKQADTLYADGLEYLASTQFDDLIIECSAAELHMQNENYESFRVGQTVRCISSPHLLDRSFPLVKMNISLDTAAKQITLGTQARQTLTRITKDVADAEDTASKEEIERVKDNVDVIKDDVRDIQDTIDNWSGGGSFDTWVHQINGRTLSTGTVNFVTIDG